MIKNEKISEIFKKMNPEQIKAIKQTQGPLLVLAGAGSGKTTVLVNRVANILILDLAKPEEILAITFTNKAADELKSRLVNILSDDAAGIWAATFHSTCAKILRIYADRIGFTHHFSIYDTDDSKRLVKNCQKAFDIDDKVLPVKSILSEISRAKERLVTVEEYTKKAKDDNRRLEIAKIYKMYQTKIQEADAMDFDDLMVNTVNLLKNNEDILAKYQEKFKYILVDEYQDTNYVQYELVRLFSLKHNNICVVGDEDQSIYKFRGANIDNILNFEKSFPKAKVIKLEQNYRSTQVILDAANEIIKNNSERKGKNLWTENKDGEKITLHTATNEQDESNYIAQQILDQVANGKKFSDFAVLYRMNSQSSVIERAFAKSGVPYRVIGGMRFYERKEIKDILAYMSVILNPADDTRLRRIINYPKRSIGEVSINIALNVAQRENLSLMEVLQTADQYPELSRCVFKLQAFTELINKLTNFANDGSHTIHEIYKMILDETKIIQEIQKEKSDSESRVQNINEFASNILQYEQDNKGSASLTGFLEEISLITDLDTHVEDEDRVTLMTMHAAKGLEFPVVFLPGFEESIFPGFQAAYSQENMEEERRLAYVGITRAKEKLYIIKAKTRMLFGSTSRNKPSRFLDELPPDLLDVTVTQPTAFFKESSAKKREREAKFQAMIYAKNYYHKTAKSAEPFAKKFKSGDSVSHKTFGTGVIVSCTAVGNDNLLEINFQKCGTKKILSNFAKLQINSAATTN